ISMAIAPRFAVSNKSRKKTMTDRDSPVTEDELHAYVDDEIAADRRGAVEAWLASHPEDAARVAHWRAQADAIRAHYGTLASEPIPARFDLDKLARGARSWRAIAAAAGIMAFLARRVVRWVAPWASAAGPRRLRYVHRAGARCPQGLRGRGASSGRGYRRRAAAFGAMAVETSRLRTADTGARAERIEAGGRTVATGSVWPGRILHV